MSSERKGALLIVMAAVLWSTGGVAIKAVDAGPLVISFYRSAIAAVVLFALFRPRVRRWTPGFIIAVISYAACLTTFVAATRWTTAANAIFIQYAGVVWVMIVSPLVLREPVRRTDAISAAVAFGGMTLFFLGGFEARGMAGNLMALLSSLFFAALIVTLRLERDASSEAAVSWGNILVAVAILPFILDELAVDARSAGLLVFLGIFQIGLAYLLFVRGLRYVTATGAMLTGMIEPVMNPVWVFFFLGERPALRALIGGAIVLGVVAVRTVIVSPRRKSPILPPD
ncbi:MAG: DMT family transporter [Thermoanaerobaculia bacterium]